MDPVKVIIFATAFLLLLFLGRKLSARSESIEIPRPPDTKPVTNDYLEPDRKTPALVGSDLPFPIYLPEITCDRDGRYNRPEFLNYYFEETDLVLGPKDPEAFYDNFYLEARDIENNHNVLYKYFVASPLGLKKALADEHLPAILLKEHAFIFARWDLPLILETISKNIIQGYAEASDENADELPNPDGPGKSK